MPHYEYQCDSCGKRFSFTRSINDPDPGYKCTDCKVDLARKFGVGGVQFNGSGFYSTEKR